MRGAQGFLPRVAAWRYDPRVARASAEAVALKVRAHLAQSVDPVDSLLIGQLRHFHLRLRNQGSHDTCAYALFAGLDAAGEHEAARTLFSTYLSEYRRERTPLEPALAKYAANAQVLRA